jgi:hypothetical protein
MGWPKTIDFYALSWSIPRKPACNLVETAQWKSQELAVGPENLEEKLHHG